MKLIVLGAAAGGGLPQWNCGCENCNEARKPNGKIKPQTQSSIAVSIDGKDWAVINASPDIRGQLQVSPQLHPKNLRHTPIKKVVLTNADIDHSVGLLTLREKQAYTLMATQQIQDVLIENPLFKALDPEFVNREAITLNDNFELLPGLRAMLFAVPGKVPLFLESKDSVVQTDMISEYTVGVLFETKENKVCYIPGCAALTDELKQHLNGLDLLLFDGTVFENEEMKNSGTGKKSGLRMGHMPIAGEKGSLESLKSVHIKKKFYIHINNTNPIWNPDSEQRSHVESHDWQVAYDGLEIEL